MKKFITTRISENSGWFPPVDMNGVFTFNRRHIPEDKHCILFFNNKNVPICYWSFGDDIQKRDEVYNELVRKYSDWL